MNRKYGVKFPNGYYCRQGTGTKYFWGQIAYVPASPRLGVQYAPGRLYMLFMTHATCSVDGALLSVL